MDKAMMALDDYMDATTEPAGVQCSRDAAVMNNFKISVGEKE